MPNSNSSFLCTIGVPAYNEERSLSRVLDSLDQQEFPENWEIHIVVVANGCTDNTLSVAQAFGHAHCNEPQEVSSEGIHWWHFTGKRYAFSVCSVPVASRNNAINIIHNFSPDGVVLLFDADVSVGPGVVKAMCQAFMTHPEHGAVASNFIGEIAPLDRSQPWLAEWCRIVLSKAMNNFDRFGVRVDGRGYGYRRNLISEHPNLIAIDLWLEGIAWQRTKGCVYVRDVYVTYRFPRTFQDFVTQHIRYVKTIDDLTHKYPELMALVYRNRKMVLGNSRRPFLIYRLIGWIFFKWMELRARNHTYREGESWEVIRSTKW